MFAVYTQFKNVSSGTINTSWQAVGWRTMHYSDKCSVFQINAKWIKMKMILKVITKAGEF